MPSVKEDWETHVDNPLITQQLDYDRIEQTRHSEEGFSQLNEEQLAAFTKILESINWQLGKSFFLSGPGRTGKMTVYNTLCHHHQGQGFVILCVASSGITALLLMGGRTAHSMFKIPIDLTDSSSCSIPKQSMLAGLLWITWAIFWDEITMQHHNAPEVLDRSLRDIQENEHPFRGITMVYRGDFQQILPVVVKGTQEEIVAASIQRSRLWQHVEILRLRRNMRLEERSSPEARDFAQWLLEVGHGRNSVQRDKMSTVSIPALMHAKSEEDHIPFVYAALAPTTLLLSPDYFLQCLILASCNRDVDSVNLRVLNHLPGEEKTYFSADSIANKLGADEPLMD